MYSAVLYCTPQQIAIELFFFKIFFQLLLHVDSAALPPDLGGSLDYDHTRWIEMKVFLYNETI